MTDQTTRPERPTEPAAPGETHAAHDGHACPVRVMNLDDVPANRRRGGELRVTLSPTTVGSTSGFMGVAILGPGETISEHYHPYSEEFVHLMCGELDVDLDGVTHRLRPEQSLMIPRDMRHRFRNTGDTEARMVFQLAPLAPKPELGHVDTEALADPREPHPGIGGGS
jgi:putative monooxygenase